jgi:ribosomal protein S8
VRKKIFNKSKSKIIIALLRMLEDNGFIYYIRVSIKDNKTEAIITRKLI